MVFPLLSRNVVDGGHGKNIELLKGGSLRIEVSQDNLFDSDSRRGDCSPSEDCSDDSKRRSAARTQPIASATTNAATGQFCSKDRSMPFLVNLVFSQLGDNRRCDQCRYPSLTSVDANRALFSGMIHLHHPVAQRFAGF